MNQRILFKLASRERPERFRDTLDNLAAMIVRPELCTIFCVLDKDDPCMALYATHVLERPELKYDFGVSESKIHAINRPVPEDIEWDIIVNWSDDQRAAVYGFDELVRSYYDTAFPEGGGLLHLADQDAKDAVPVLYIADKAYHSRDGWIYHPRYKSVWCDNHSMRLAKLRGRYSYVPDVIFHHMNPAYGHLPRDPLFDRQQAQWEEDEATYKYFESINFEQ